MADKTGVTKKAETTEPTIKKHEVYKYFTEELTKKLKDLYLLKQGEQYALELPDRERVVSVAWDDFQKSDYSLVRYQTASGGNNSKQRFPKNPQSVVSAFVTVVRITDKSYTRNG